MGGGNIILLNGTSSAGKTTIAQAIQEVMEAPYLHMGIDQFLIEHLPKGLIVYSDDAAHQRHRPDCAPLARSRPRRHPSQAPPAAGRGSAMGHV